MLPIILALFDRAPGDRSRPTALHGQFVVGGPSRSEVRSDLNIIVRRSGKPPGHQAQTSQVLWPRAPERSCQEPPSICELPAPLASCPRDPGCAAPFSSRIPTGARTDSREERIIKSKTADRLTTGLDLVILVAMSPFREPTPIEVKIKDERMFTRIGLDDLTPWLGTCQSELGK